MLKKNQFWGRYRQDDDIQQCPVMSTSGSDGGGNDSQRKPYDEDNHYADESSKAKHSECNSHASEHRSSRLNRRKRSRNGEMAEAEKEQCPPHKRKRRTSKRSRWETDDARWKDGGKKRWIRTWTRPRVRSGSRPAKAVTFIGSAGAH